MFSVIYDIKYAACERFDVRIEMINNDYSALCQGLTAFSSCLRRNNIRIMLTSLHTLLLVVSQLIFPILDYVDIVYQNTKEKILKPLNT